MPAPSCSIVVDARALNYSGIGRYLRAILGEVLADPRFARVVLLGDPSALGSFVDAHGATKPVRLLAYPDALYSPSAQAAWLAMRARGDVRCDVAFFPHYDAPVVGMPARSVVTVHDLIHFKVPESFPAWKRAVAGEVFDRVVGRAARVLTGSDATRRDIAERLPRCAGKIEVVPYGVSPFFTRVAPDSDPGRPDLRPFLLCVGNRKPHKNLVAAVETLAILRREDPSLRLVVVGRAYPGWDAVVARAEELGVRDAVVELDEVPDDLLRWLYSHCEALLFPSLYEGFGLPPLEAFACGAPVVASNRSSLPEVVGDAGILVDPFDWHAMAAAVDRLRRDPAARAELGRRGIARAAGFSWGSSVERTLDLLLEAARGPAAREPARRPFGPDAQPDPLP